MLYTIIDQTDIFYSPQNITYSYHRINNTLLQCSSQNHRLLLSRIISTNPKDFLNNAYQIGMPPAISHKA